MALQTVTGQQIIDLARLYADERPAGVGAFVNPTEDLVLVNAAIPALYDLLLSLGGDSYFAVDDTSKSTAVGVSTVALPATYYALKSVHLVWSSTDHEELKPLVNDADRFRLVDEAQWGQHGPKAFRQLPASIEIYPTPQSVQQVIYRYVPVATQLVTLNDTTPSINGWHKLVALQIAMELRTIRGLPNGMLQNLFEREKERIETIAAERHLNEPAQIRDVEPEYRVRRGGWYR